MKYRLRRAVKKIFYYSPEFLKSFVQKNRTKKKLEDAKIRYKRTKITKQDLSLILDKIEINSDVFLHTSIISIGKVSGGTKYIANSILDKIDITKNTLLVSALPYRGRFQDYLENKPVFDVRTAPIEMGEVNNYLSKLEGAKRSLHPTHSVVAIGPKSSSYVSKHHLDDTPFKKNSPYYKIIVNNAIIMMFGTDLLHNTTIHAVEDLLNFDFPFKIYSDEIYKVKVIDNQGNESFVQTKCHAKYASTIRSGLILQDRMLKNKLIQIYPIGESQIMIFKAKDMALTYLDILLEGNSIYGKFKLSKALIDEIEYQKNTLYLSLSDKQI